jgi:hypothetical protein
VVFYIKPDHCLTAASSIGSRREAGFVRCVEFRLRRQDQYERFPDDLRRCRVTANIAGISVDIGLTGMTRASRPKSGHLYLAQKGQKKNYSRMSPLLSTAQSHDRAPGLSSAISSRRRRDVAVNDELRARTMA